MSGVKEQLQGRLFEERNLPVRAPMARTEDPPTSHEAAGVIEASLGKIQREVLDAYARCGPMTARTAERLPEFEQYGFATIRKRISELWHGGYLVDGGVDRSRRAPATIYRVPT